MFRFEEDETPNSRAAVKVLGAPLLTPFPLIDPDNPEADEDAIGTWVATAAQVAAAGGESLIPDDKFL